MECRHHICAAQISKQTVSGMLVLHVSSDKPGHSCLINGVLQSMWSSKLRACRHQLIPFSTMPMSLQGC